jgi:hypothetical protein
MKPVTSVGEQKTNIFHSLYQELLIMRYLAVIISLFYRFCCKISYKGGDYGRYYRSASP